MFTSRYRAYWPILFLLVAIFVLVIIGYGIYVRAIYPDPGTSLDYITGTVLEIDPQGLWKELGFRSGDRILIVGGLPWMQAHSAYDGLIPGRMARWVIERDGRMLELQAQLPSPTRSQILQSLIPLVVALFYWGIAIYLWLHNPRHPLIHRFFLLSQAIALVLVGGSLGTYTVRWGQLLFQYAFLSTVPLALHFFADFPQKKHDAFIRRGIILAYCIAILLAAESTLAYLGLLPTWVNSVDSYLRGGFYFVGLLATAAVFFRNWFKASRLVYQRQRLILAGVLVSLLPIVFFYLGFVLLDRPPIVSLNLFFFSLIFLPLAVAYAIRSGELGTIDWFLNRTLVRVLLFSVMIGGYVSAFWILLTFLSESRSSLILIAATLAVVLAVVFSPLQRFFQRWVDAFFYRGWYDYQSVVKRTSKELSAAQQPQEITQSLLENVTTGMKLRCACLLWPSLTTDGVHELFVHAPQGCPFQETADRKFHANTPFALTLQMLDEPVTTTHLYQRVPVSSLSPAEHRLLTCPHAKLWIPIRPMNASFAAALIAGTKLDNEPFSPEDRGIFKDLARYTGIVMHNQQLLRQLQQREKALALLYRNLSNAREEERKRIAQELHDSVLQDIHIIYHELRELKKAHPEIPAHQTKEVAQRIRQVMDDVRRICNDLRPVTLDVLGLADAIGFLVRKFAERTGIEAQYVVLGDEMTRLDEEIENTLFRIAQEALWNIEKHAQATQVHILLNYPQRHTPPAEAHVRLQIKDNGRGFDPASVFNAAPQQTSLGLLHMRERAIMIGGSFRLESHPGRGVLIRVDVPLQAQHGAGSTHTLPATAQLPAPTGQDR